MLVTYCYSASAGSLGGLPIKADYLVNIRAVAKKTLGSKRYVPEISVSGASDTRGGVFNDFRGFYPIVEKGFMVEQSALDYARQLVENQAGGGMFPCTVLVYEAGKPLSLFDGRNKAWSAC